jgi:plasmid stabilization system protein ParE
MSQVVWTPVAESDLDEILYYIAIVDRRPATSERIYYEIKAVIEKHVEQGLAGHEHPSARQDGGTSATSVGWYSSGLGRLALRSCAS